MIAVPDDPAFDVWLRARLRARRMSQRQLAHLSQVDHSTISRLLAGDRTPTLATARKLARVLGERGDGAVTPHELLPASAQSHPAAGVEHALRADDQLTEAHVRRVMEIYLRMRRLPAPPTVARAVLRAVQPPAPPTGN